MRSHHSQGFTLLELSIVIIIIAVIGASGLVLQKGQVEAAAYRSTLQKMQVIEQALKAYQLAYKRLPCPAQAELAQGNVNYGREVDNPGFCINGALAVTKSSYAIAEGALPVDTLGLPRDIMVDGWGRKFSYAVFKGYTADRAFDYIEINRHCAAPTINSVSGRTLSRNAMFVLYSAGKNGHGAYVPSGSRVVSVSSSTAERQNCDCNGAGAATTYNAVYVLDDQTPTFDDIVMYRERWQWQKEKDSPVAPYDLIGNRTRADLRAITHCEGYLREDLLDMDPPGDPSLVVEEFYVTRNRNRIAYLERDTGFMVLFERRGRQYVEYFRMPIPASTAPTGNTETIHLTDDGRYLALGIYWFEDHFAVYEWNGTTYVRLPHPVMTIPWAWTTRSLAMTEDAKYIVFKRRYSSPDNDKLRFYKREGTTITPLPIINQANIVETDDINHGMVWSNDGSYLVLPGDTEAQIYRRYGDKLVFQPGQPTPTMGTYTSDVTLFDFSPDGRYLAVGREPDPSSIVNVYRIDRGNFEEISLPLSPQDPTANAQAYFTHDSRYLMVYYNQNNEMQVFKIDSTTDTFTLVQTNQRFGTALYLRHIQYEIY